MLCRNLCIACLHPLTKENYKNFFFGASAEHYVSGRAFYYGLEAHKYNPDFGFDISVTNRAREIFENEENRKLDIQVKATHLIKDLARFTIKEAELDFLIAQDNAAIVFCIYKVDIFAKPVWFEDDREGMLALEERLDRSFIESVFHNQRASRRDRADAQNIDIDDYEIETFWLYSNQLRKAIEVGILNKKLNKKINEYYYEMNIIYKNDTYVFEAIDKNGNETVKYPKVEIKKLRYLFRPEKESMFMVDLFYDDDVC
ncbi:hypothetical protein [Vibrio parahaemolyticus]|uniref:hypothetical protein n=1 Tax=Vibrio parahaemolyticus TaxID=670 RepID=UPI000446F594|nr:hypothetical protein [Vibrio parahaemolyticus]ETZ11527.1 hypothetical protein AJ90_22610 [Vibrio parahaemolyticus M0605]ELA7626240.1 hypothetical protein [Vibrio parahaemolyticus]ELY2121218.1 hypothetical protein [Vibrio parahaemolyticus]WMN69523.1 hypothetical protein NI387_07155 [Vibrio parahaemolyticus]HBC3988020.1 hypothetical protein [Vibrio parahaemolyticus]